MIYFIISSASTLLFFFFALFTSALAQVSLPLQIDTSGDPIQMQADHISYDRALNLYVAEGKVEILQGNRKLTADRVLLNARTNEAEAAGNVVLLQGEDVLSSERMKIDLEANLGIIIKGSLFLKKQNFYLRGEEIERLGEETYRVRRGSFTACDGEWPAWRFTGRETLVTLEEYASVWGATFQVKNFPLLYSPYLFFPVKTKRQSGLLIPRISYSETSGVEVANAYFWAIAPNRDATFYLDLASIKGVGEGIEYRYVRSKESAGIFYGYHTREWAQYREKRTDQLDRKPDRWQVDLQYEEYFNQNFFAKTKIRELSDRQYFKDYGQTYEERGSEQVYSFLSITKIWERFSLFGEVRQTVDLRRDDKSTLQNFPVMNFMGIRQQILNSPFYFGLDSSYGYFWREQGITGHRLDLHPRASLPLRWKIFEITPDLGVRETIYRSRNGAEESHSRKLWDFKTTMATEIYRIFETGSKDVPRWKHLVRPEIVYTYIPDVDQRQIPDYDTPVPKTNAITYGITQRLTGKVFDNAGKSRYHEFAYFKLSQSYDLFEANRRVSPGSEPSRPFSVIRGELRVHTLKYLKAEKVTTYDPNQNRFLTFYTSAELTDLRGDRLNLEYTWANGTQDQINASLKVKIMPALDGSYGIRYSRLDSQTLESLYGLHYRHQCWSVEMSYSERPSIAGQPAEKKAMVMLTLMGVTSVGKQ
ncbi:MAG: LPS-assembly protein LptD [Deltaproteobacteria bacterium]|nr:LPS-assembly protein LptD [Deltaproteobacteria bacterium]